MLRRIAERLSRGVVIKRRLPPSFNRARMYVTPDAALAYWKPGLMGRDPSILRLAKEYVKPGDVVWDVGANVGLLSIAAAHRTGPEGFVLAVEPDIWLVQLLRRTLSLKENRHLKVWPLACAVADVAGTATFAIAARGRASSGLEVTGHRSQAGGTRERQMVPTLSLDLLLEDVRPPRLLKIDVEGAEVLVLRGGSRILSDIRPVIHCETDDKTADAVTEILKAAKYRLYDHDASAERLIEVARCTFNTLAIAT